MRHATQRQLGRRLSLVAGNSDAALALLQALTGRQHRIADLADQEATGAVIAPCPFHGTRAPLSCPACRGAGRVTVESITIRAAA